MNLPGPFGVSFGRTAKQQARRNLRVRAYERQIQQESVLRAQHQQVMQARNRAWFAAHPVAKRWYYAFLILCAASTALVFVIALIQGGGHVR